jgi:hypothetical protein
MILVFLVSCNDYEQNNQAIPNYFTDIATVANPNLNSGFYFTLDNNDKMWVTSTNFPYYIPKTGQRIIASYSILSTADTSRLYSHKVELNDVYEVLTKNIFTISPATQDSIGNDPISIRDMWIGSDYLNVQFAFPGYNMTHFINLVSDTTQIYTDGKIHLEFRHNANHDNPIYSRSGIVSFDLSSLKSLSTGNSINLVIQTHEFTTPEIHTYEFTYKFNSPMLAPVKHFILPQKAGKIS